jgi:hypothetical protein
VVLKRRVNGFQLCFALPILPDLESAEVSNQAVLPLNFHANSRKGDMKERAKEIRCFKALQQLLRGRDPMPLAFFEKLVHR